MPPKLFNMDDPLIKEAEEVLARLSAQGITVFHNPTYGIMLMGARPDSPVPGRKDMDTAYALHNEISMLFAMQTLAQVVSSIEGCRVALADVCRRINGQPLDRLEAKKEG